MSKPAAIPLFGDAYLADTTHLTTEEHGAYLLLMIAAWRQADCGLPMDDKKLARITGMSTKKWSAVKDTILDFWKVENGRIYQPRLLKEHEYSCRKSEANRKSAEARWNKQPIENIEGGECDRISEGNAPPPPPPPPTDKKEDDKSSSKENGIEVEEVEVEVVDVDDEPEPPAPPKAAKTKASKSAPFNPDTFDLPDTIPADAWNQFVAMRRDTNRKIKTEYGANLLVGKLEELAEAGHPPGEVLKQSIMFEYQGLFPLKGISNGRGNRQATGFDGGRESFNPMVEAYAEERARAVGEQPELYE